MLCDREEEDGPCPEKCPDKNVESLIALHRERVMKGVKKYGVTTDRTDLSLRDWLQHALEESMDQCVYLKRAIEELDRKEQRVLQI